jgi:hypothetical protein
MARPCLASALNLADGQDIAAIAGLNATMQSQAAIAIRFVRIWRTLNSSREVLSERHQKHVTDGAKA